jgi:hypothetical protein
MAPFYVFATEWNGEDKVYSLCDSKVQNEYQKGLLYDIFAALHFEGDLGLVNQTTIMAELFNLTSENDSKNAALKKL